jgi:hypothetical protein
MMNFTAHRERPAAPCNIPQRQPAQPEGEASPVESAQLPEDVIRQRVSMALRNMHGRLCHSGRDYGVQLVQQ